MPVTDLRIYTRIEFMILVLYESKGIPCAGQAGRWENLDSIFSSNRFCIHCTCALVAQVAREHAG